MENFIYNLYRLFLFIVLSKSLFAQDADRGVVSPNGNLQVLICSGTSLWPDSRPVGFLSRAIVVAYKGQPIWSGFTEGRKNVVYWGSADRVAISDQPDAANIALLVIERRPPLPVCRLVDLNFLRAEGCRLTQAKPNQYLSKETLTDLRWESPDTIAGIYRFGRSGSNVDLPFRAEVAKGPGNIVAKLIP